MKTAKLDTLFDTMLQNGLHHGAQLAVYRNGSLVYQRSGGFADKQHRRPVSPQTPFMIYSVTKTFTAAAVHQLADRGRIDLEAPLADYWPEFGRKGKQNITISQLLSAPERHTAPRNTPGHTVLAPAILVSQAGGRPEHCPPAAGQKLLPHVLRPRSPGRAHTPGGRPHSGSLSC
jgi:CubicO group peptidase (beta-lactamase class C family)